MPRIPVAGPWITQREIDYVTEAVTRGWYADANLFPGRFEDAFARYLGRRHAITLPSCTSALHLALLSLGVGAGDEVIVPDITWIATAAPVRYMGAEVVFADIEPDTWCLSADSFRECITPRTKAVIPVDLYGNMPDMDAILGIADRRGIAVIEDAAEAIASESGGRKAGAFGAASAFSFHGSKTLTTGEGGMLVTDSDAVNDRVRFLQNHGRPPGDRMFRNIEVAHKYRMSGLQAALGLAQLERIEELTARKREIFRWYAEELGDGPEVTLNVEKSGTKNTYWMVTIIVDPRLGPRKEELMARLDAAGIDSRPFFHPLSSLPAYEGCREAERARARNTVSYRLSPFGVNLPSALCLTREDVRRVCGVVRETLQEAARIGR